jgi:hypothetical protein
MAVGQASREPFPVPILVLCSISVRATASSSAAEFFAPGLDLERRDCPGDASVVAPARLPQIRRGPFRKSGTLA